MIMSLLIVIELVTTIMNLIVINGYWKSYHYCRYTNKWLAGIVIVVTIKCVSFSFIIIIYVYHQSYHYYDHGVYRPFMGGKLVKPLN